MVALAEMGKNPEELEAPKPRNAERVRRGLLVRGSTDEVVQGLREEFLQVLSEEEPQLLEQLYGRLKLHWRKVEALQLPPRWAGIESAPQVAPWLTNWLRDRGLDAFMDRWFESVAIFTLQNWLHRETEGPLPDSDDPAAVKAREDRLNEVCASRLSGEPVIPWFESHGWGAARPLRFYVQALRRQPDWLDEGGSRSDYVPSEFSFRTSVVFDWRFKRPTDVLKLLTDDLSERFRIHAAEEAELARSVGYDLQAANSPDRETLRKLVWFQVRRMEYTDIIKRCFRPKPTEAQTTDSQCAHHLNDLRIKEAKNLPDRVGEMAHRLGLRLRPAATGRKRRASPDEPQRMPGAGSRSLRLPRGRQAR
jgi:hypothetical protein